MAVYFTLAVECYREADAIRLGELLRPLVLHVGIHHIPMARVGVFSEFSFWYVFVQPQGPGYSQYGYGEGLNDLDVIDQIIEQLYAFVGAESGIRRATCGYEAQDDFDLWGEPDFTSFDIPNLVYDKSAADRSTGAEDFGLHYYRNPPRVIDWSGWVPPTIP